MSGSVTIRKKTSAGFTIVELLIVIVVIAIVAAISITAYNGIQTRAENTKTIQGVSQSLKMLANYKVLNGDYPTHPGTTYACIGTGYTGNVCATATDGTTPSAVNNATFNAALQTVATLPQLSTKSLSLSNGSYAAGASFEYNQRMVRYHLSGASQQCSAGGTGFTYGSVTQCRITLE